jgi:hypothetical protein
MLTEDRKAHIESVAKTHAEMSYDAGFDAATLPPSAMRFISDRLHHFDENGVEWLCYATAYATQMRKCIAEGR